MIIGLTAAVLSSICLTIMVITDKLMIGDCYEDDPMPAWIISSIAGSLFGLFLTFTGWILVQIFSDYSITSLAKLSVDLFWPHGVFVLLAGALSIQTLYHYFSCFSVNGEATSIAGWLSLTPIFILLTMQFISLLNEKGSFMLDLSLNTFEKSAEFVVLAILATLCLAAFEILTQHSADKMRYVKHVFLMIFFSTVYAVLIHIAVTEVNISIAPGWLATLVLLPYYWAGFIFGARALLNKLARFDFFTKFNTRIINYLPAIITTEIIGMLVFFSEFYGLSALDPTLVSIIIGAHVLLVFTVTLALGYWRARLEQQGRTEVFIIKMRLSVSRLPLVSFSVGRLYLTFGLLIASAAAIYHLSIMVF